ncbi:hypothetical protein V5F77_13630 [Xanthobacter sp. DSM 24535]|uniref:hypothetical protein n=1 Tax=Roseixanthobacter psychrophilus TaxID=3119917 RepID=UPI0037290134
MRALRDYSLLEWASATPLMHRARRARNILVDLSYRRCRAAGQTEVLRALAAHRGGTLAFTIAFNLPEAIALLSHAMMRFVPGAQLVVCDNSTKAEARVAIAALCAERGHIYCPLPREPLSRFSTNGSRSHGVALNWIYHNLIRPTAPKVFALLDHDLVPLARDDLAARVAAQPAYGMVRHGDRFGCWFLWPGYSVFDFAATADFALDFGTDTPLTLDTGGQNWHRLYRRLTLGEMRQARTREVYLLDGAGGREPYLLTDTWLHVGGAGHRGGGAAALERVRLAFAADPDGLLDALLAEAA